MYSTFLGILNFFKKINISFVFYKFQIHSRIK
nr:MAG TPA: hypothetical protein [Caudoviricetes sp.]